MLLGKLPIPKKHDGPSFIKIRVQVPKISMVWTHTRHTHDTRHTRSRPSHSPRRVSNRRGQKHDGPSFIKIRVRVPEISKVGTDTQTDRLRHQGYVIVHRLKSQSGTKRKKMDCLPSIPCYFSTNGARGLGQILN